MALSGLLYTAALLTQESAVPFALLFLWPVVRCWQKPGGTGRRYGALVHLALAAGFVVVWVLAPKREGIRGEGFQTKALLFLVQGIVFPVARALAVLGLDLPLLPLAAVLCVAWLGLVLVTWKTDRGKSGLVASLLILLGIAPVWAGLSWDYVKIGSRLLYPATLGIGVLWSRLLEWTGAKARAPRLVGYVIAFIVLLMSVSQWARFERLYGAGTAHLAEAVAIMAAEPAQPLLFVNYPDRMEIRPALYPLGYWGLTLAPVAEPLSYYALSARGQSADARCYASYANGYSARECWPYRVEMRGMDLQAEELYEQAKRTDAIFITEYEPYGMLSLRQVGSLRPDDGRPAVARFGDRTELLGARAAPSVADERKLTIDLTWRALAPLHNEDTIFLHVLTADGEYVQGKDGDAIGELLPMEAWTPGWVVTDRREVPLEGLSPGSYVVTIGIYNRASGERYAAQRADGQPVPMDELPVHALPLP